MWGRVSDPSWPSAARQGLAVFMEEKFETGISRENLVFGDGATFRGCGTRFAQPKRPRGLKPHIFLTTYAALKGRSSTEVPIFAGSYAASFSRAAGFGKQRRCGVRFQPFNIFVFYPGP